MVVAAATTARLLVLRPKPAINVLGRNLGFADPYRGAGLIVCRLDIKDCDSTTSLAFANHAEQDTAHWIDLCAAVEKTIFCDLLFRRSDMAKTNLTRTYPWYGAIPICGLLAAWRCAHGDLKALTT